MNLHFWLYSENPANSENSGSDNYFPITLAISSTLFE